MDGTYTVINRPLPVDMNRFWSLTTTKARLQQFFINWACENYRDHRPVYLGGSHENDLSACLRVVHRSGNYIRLLKCDDEEADDRIMLHANHAVLVDQFGKIIKASADTDVFICLMYHFCRWNEFDLKELWVMSGQGHSTRAVPVHNLVTDNHGSMRSCYHANTTCFEWL